MGKVLGSVQVKVTMHKYYSVPLVLDEGNPYAQLERMLENEEIPWPTSSKLRRRW